MLRMKTTVCIEAPAERVWEYLSTVENIGDWVPAILSARCETGTRRGAGTVRVCKLEKFTVREEFLEWDEGRSFKYRGTGAPMIEWATNRWTVEAVGNKTLVTSEAELKVKGGLLGRLLEPLVYLAARLGLPNSLAPLKHYCETGQSFTGNPRHLPVPDALC